MNLINDSVLIDFHFIVKMTITPAFSHDTLTPKRGEIIVAISKQILAKPHRGDMLIEHNEICLRKPYHPDWVYLSS